MVFFIWLSYAISCATISCIIGSKKGETLGSFLIGFLLGPLGIIFTILLKGNRINCPHCKELIHKDVTKCPYCQSEIIKF